MIARLRGARGPGAAVDAGADGRPAAAPPGERARREPLALWLAGAVPVLAAAAVLNTVRISQNGYANIFYAAAVRSMLESWHNFFFVSFDPLGLVTVDKPPLALWVQAASAKVFGFSPLSLLLPQALLGVAACAAVYVLVGRRFGVLPGLIAGVATAVFPSFVAVSRANGVDTLLILLLVLACWAGVRACETGRLRSLLAAAVLVGLAFNTKTLAGYLAVPGIAFAYLVCGPATIRRRVLALVLAGAVMGVVSFAWIAAVEATPASKRPYVGSSTNNTELGLTFEYNGFGRVEGQNGGPGQVHEKPGARVSLHEEAKIDAALVRRYHPKPRHYPTFPPSQIRGHEKDPIPFGGSPGPFRLFGHGLGDQAGWMLPFAFVGLIAALLLWWFDSRSPAAETAGPERSRPARGRRDPRLAVTLVFGGWLLVEAVVLSTSKGIVHPYYVSALAPGAGAMTGIGACALWRMCAGNRRLAGVVLATVAIAGTAVCEILLMHRHEYMRSFAPALAAIAALSPVVLVGAALLRRRALAAGAVTTAVALLLVVPAGYASTTWSAPVEATFPAAGPKAAAGDGGYGVSPRSLAIDRAIESYVRARHPGRYELLTVASDTAAPFILLGMRAAALGGYSGTDQVMNGPQLARLVKRHEARFVLLGGEYSTRGGNGATQATLRACRELAPFQWNSPVPFAFGLVLFDCAGRERQLAAA